MSTATTAGPLSDQTQQPQAKEPPARLTPTDIDEIIDAIDQKKAARSLLEEQIKDLTNLLNAQSDDPKDRGVIHVQGERFDATLDRRHNVTYAKVRGADDPLIVLAKTYPALLPMIKIKAEERTSHVEQLFDQVTLGKGTQADLELAEKLMAIRKVSKSVYFQAKKLIKV